MKTQLQILALMLKYLVLATFILAAAAAYFWLTWEPAPDTYSIYIEIAPKEVPSER